MTQNEMILDMLRVGPITQLDALNEIGCMRLASRISDLRKAGNIINSNMQSKRNRFGKKISFAVYTLVKEKSNV